jgi:hypothetical protein|tara:strand:+ start:57 stop:263 length:207 start_codon:yes stop_codon:yes gene_type:complete
MKKTILKDIKDSLETKSNARNSMGCSENYYNPNYLIGKCFTEEELNKLEETELNNLIKLAEFAGEMFF